MELGIRSAQQLAAAKAARAAWECPPGVDPNSFEGQILACLVEVKAVLGAGLEVTPGDGWAAMFEAAITAALTSQLQGIIEAALTSALPGITLNVDATQVGTWVVEVSALPDVDISQASIDAQAVAIADAIGDLLPLDVTISGGELTVTLANEPITVVVTQEDGGVLNITGSVSIDGTVTVDNFPTEISVNNLPDFEALTLSVSVGNWPESFAIPDVQFDGLLEALAALEETTITIDAAQWAALCKKFDDLLTPYLVDCPVVDGGGDSGGEQFGTCDCKIGAAQFDPDVGRGRDKIAANGDGTYTVSGGTTQGIMTMLLHPDSTHPAANCDLVLMHVMRDGASNEPAGDTGWLLIHPGQVVSVSGTGYALSSTIVWDPRVKFSTQCKEADVVAAIVAAQGGDGQLGAAQIATLMASNALVTNGAGALDGSGNGFYLNGYAWDVAANAGTAPQFPGNEFGRCYTLVVDENCHPAEPEPAEQTIGVLGKLDEAMLKCLQEQKALLQTIATNTADLAERVSALEALPQTCAFARVDSADALVADLNVDGYSHVNGSGVYVFTLAAAPPANWYLLLGQAFFATDLTTDYALAGNVLTIRTKRGDNGVAADVPTDAGFSWEIKATK